MKMTKAALKKLIKEEMDGQGFVYTVGKGVTKADPWRDTPQTNDELYEAVRKASRILEDLPLEDLPESVTQAAQNLRDALDTMPAPEKETSPFKDDPLTPGRADVYSYLNET
tara:strand:+ start:174 stop:509 length:336 start_codon:yes stop_codon:yes gene_type:complete